jgi:hypothetical protein
MTRKNETDIPRLLLERLPKMEVETIGEAAADRFRFEHSLLSAARLTHEREVTLVKDVVGEQEFAQTQASRKSSSEAE